MPRPEDRHLLYQALPYHLIHDNLNNRASEVHKYLLDRSILYSCYRAKSTVNCIKVSDTIDRYVRCIIMVYIDEAL